MTLDELKASSLLVKILDYAEMFEEERYPFAIERHWRHPKIMLPRTEPWTGRFFKSFYKFAKLMEAIPEVDPRDWIVAQFKYVKGTREVRPTDLASEWSIYRYKKHMRLKDKAVDTEMDINFIKQKEKEFIDLYIKNNKIEHSTLWEPLHSFDGKNVPLFIFLWLSKRITFNYILEAYPERVLEWSKKLLAWNLIDEKTAKSVSTKLYRNKYGEDDAPEATP